jgi:hypothetical protein
MPYPPISREFWNGTADIIGEDPLHKLETPNDDTNLRVICFAVDCDVRGGVGVGVGDIVVLPLAVAVALAVAATTPTTVLLAACNLVKTVSIG